MDNETPEEKKHINAEINEIKHELHIHRSDAKLTKEEIMEIFKRAIPQFGKQIDDEIRAQFENKQEEPPQEPEEQPQEPEPGQEKQQDEPEQGQD